jgi:PKD repeat protein
MPRILMRIVFISALFIVQFSFAQKEANSWYFGWQIAVDFNAGAPVALNNSAMNQYEGCSSLSDKNTGAILFYTDGQSVYTASHTVMPNGTGLTGEQSSAQSALIVPMPGTSTQYYIFTAGEYFSAGVAGYRYSIVDLSLNGGLGDVTATKNVLLYAPACEKLCGVKNAAGTGYWMATHEFTGNNFVMFEVTAVGVSAPHVVPCGTSYSGTEPIGCMKFSPDGTRLATVLSGQNMAEVYDFNASTGDVTNPLTIGPVAGNLYVYGISFSPNGNLLYVSEENSNFLSQFDVTLGSAAAITASNVNVGSTSQPAFQTLQLAPDGKLYCTNNGSFFLGVVNAPDSAGVACNYVDAGFNLNGLTVGYGLPGFVESLFMQEVPPVALFSAPNHICPGTCTDFTNLSINATSFLWTFAGANPSTSADANPTNICYNTPGSYTVQLIATNAVTSDTLTLNNYLTVYPYPAAQGILQSGDTLFANLGSVSYQWYHAGVIIPGATEYYYVAVQGGDYNVVCTDVNRCEVEAAIFDVIAGIQSIAQSHSAFIYPIPAAGILTVRTSMFPAGRTVLKIYSVAGAEAVVIPEFELKDETAVDISSLAPGVYIVELLAEDLIVHSKFIKASDSGTQ